MTPTERDPLHILAYGDSGSGKSTFAATGPKPMIVWAFDPFGKDRPYTRGAHSLQWIGDTPGRVRHVYHTEEQARNEEPAVRIEYYIDPDPYHPTAAQRFQARLADIHGELDFWRSGVVDSLTFFELAARLWSQYSLNKTARDNRQHYGFSTELLEQVVQLRLGCLPINIFVLCHVNEDKDEMHGEILRNPLAPGKLSKKLPGGYSELYHHFVKRNENGALEYWLQTQNDGVYNASTQIGAPNPCRPTWDAIWANYQP